MNNIIITIKKELRTILRDKKTIAVMFIYPIMIPVLMFLYGNIYENSDTEVTTYTIGINYTLEENEKEIIKNLNLEYKEYESIDDMQKSYEEQEITGYITKENNQYNLYIDSSNSGGLTTADLMYQYLNLYSTELTNQYLINEGINLEEAYNNIEISETELNNNNFLVVLLISISLTYIILSICISTSNMAIQTTATEKENGTLETILTFPIKKTELILGKYFSSVIIGFIAALVSLIFMIVSLVIGKNEFTIFESIDLSLSFWTIFGSIITIISASIFIAGISLLLTAFSKSYKEAQGQSSLITLLCMIPMFISILEINITETYYLIPICNFNQILSDLFMNNINFINILLTASSTIVYSTIVIIFIIKAYNSEKILFTN